MSPPRRVGRAASLPGLDRLVPATEREWQRTLVEGFEMFGYVVQHVYKMPAKDGSYRTSTTAVGWPDLTAFKGQHIIGCEVKGVKTSVDAAQIEWLERFALIPTGRGWILRPQDDWTLIVKWMAHPADAPRRYGWGDHRTPPT